MRLYLMSSELLFLNFVRYHIIVNTWSHPQLKLSSMHISLRVLITVMVCCTAFPRNPSTGCRVFSTLQPGWWPWQGNTTISLDVEFRIQYKINLQFFKSLKNISPQYLSEKLKLKNSNGPRSDKRKKKMYLKIPPEILQWPKHSLWRGQSSGILCLTNWRLRTKLCTFKNEFETYLLKVAFNLS